MSADTIPKEDPLRVALLALAHLLNDWYMNYIRTLLPFLVALGVVGVGRGTLLVTAFTFPSSLRQPFFGYLVDRRGQRWLVYAGTLLRGALLGMPGIVRSRACSSGAAGPYRAKTWPPICVTTGRDQIHGLTGLAGFQK